MRVPARVLVSRVLVSRVLVSTALAACAGLAFHRVVPYRPLVPVVVVSAVVPATLCLVLACWRRPAGLSLAVAVVAWLLADSVVVLHAVPGAASVRAEWHGLNTGWRQALGTVLPLGADPRVLLSVSALVWLACWVAAESALRVRSALVPALAPAAVFVLALLAGASGPGSSVIEAAALVALTGLLVLADARRGLRRAAGGLLVVAVAAAVAGFGGPRLAYAHARAPYAPRLDAAAGPAPAVSPLDQLSAWLSAPDTVLFQVRMSVPEDLRLAVLDQFDGQEWTSDARYLPTGSRVPGASANPATITVTQRITIGTLDSAWLPAVIRPAAVTGTAVSVDPVDGQVLASGGTRPGLSYQVVSQVPQYSADQLRAAVPADDAAAMAALSLPPRVPAIIRQTAQQATAGAGFPYQQAARLAGWLRATGRYVPDAPPGHTYGHIAYFLSKSRRGTSEQFAAAFALMARTLGLPSRVAVGFRPGPAGPDGLRVVTGADALAWPEVGFRGLGWVPFYPTPGSAGPANTAQVLGVGESAQRQKIDQSLAAPVSTPGPRAPATRRSAAPAGRGLPVVWLIAAAGPAVLVLVLAVLGYLALALLLPWRRATRLRAAADHDPARAIAGAWLETVRELRVAGLVGVTSHTTSETAGLGASRLGAEAGRPLTELATLADRCEFGSVAPDRATALAAWSDHDAVRAAVRGSVPVLVRARRRVRPVRG
jgi:transglutaminase-like putative cysteine protease